MDKQSICSVGLDPERNHVRLKLTGLMDEATIEEIIQQIDRDLARMKAEGGRPGSYLTLVDLREHAIQSKEVMPCFMRLAEKFSPLSRRTAILLSGSILQKLQVQRVPNAYDHAFFTNEEDALQWLHG